MNNTSLRSITRKATQYIQKDQVGKIKRLKSRYAGLDTILLSVPNDEDAIDNIFNMTKINMKKISLLQYSIIYGAKKCFNYFINLAINDNVNLGRHSLHLATNRLDIYYIDQLLKKWGDNDIWINIRDNREGYTGLSNYLVHEDIEYSNSFFNEPERTLEEVRELKVKITEIFTSYPTLNVLLRDTRGTNIFDVLDNSPSDNTIKNILTTHESMGEFRNIGLIINNYDVNDTRRGLMSFPEDHVIRFTTHDTERDNDDDLYEERDIDLVMTQSHVNREQAIIALTNANGDIVNAIMNLS
tara:strand:- start:391 stop:1287 length:897 start_codon:yes stop_codon:yes gene_type:complete